MLTTLDGPRGTNDWGVIDWSTNEIVYDESGERTPLTTAEFILTAGKYKGYKLSEVDNTWYLKFLMDKNPDDYLLQEMFGRRLKELA